MNSIICASCNNLISVRFETAFIDQVKVHNCFLAIKPERGKAPFLRNIKDSVGNVFDIAPGGFIERRRDFQYEQEIDEANRMVNIRMQGSSERQIRRKIAELKAKYGDRLNPITTTRELSFPEAQFNFRSEFGEAALRTVAKMAFEYLATHVARWRVVEPAFDPIRDYIMNGVVADRPPVFFDAQAPAVQLVLGPVDHSITMIASEVAGATYAYVRLYGGLFFCILLTHQWNGPSVSWEHVVNPLTGEARDQSIGINSPLGVADILMAEAVVASTPGASRAMMQDTASKIMQISEERRPDLQREYLVGKAWRETVDAKNGQPITREDINRFSEYVVRELVEPYLKVPGTLEA